VTVTRRLHPAGIAVLGLRALRELAIPAVVALLAMVGGGGGGTGSLVRAGLFALAAAALATVAGFVAWRTVSYAISDTAISARRGVFSVKETVVPLDRVQGVDTVQGPLQRLFGVTSVHVQAAGGSSQGEIVLEALSPQAAAELRERLGGPAPALAGTDAVAEPDAAWRLGRGRLLVAALTAGQLGVILPVLAGASQLLDDLVPDDDERGAVAGLVPDTLGEAGLAVLALLLAAWLLSILGAVVAFAGFSAVRRGDTLEIRRGLLARREATVPLARVQAAVVLAGVLRQPFGLAALRVEVAGYAKEAGAAQTLFPLLRAREVEAFLAQMLPGLADDAARLAPAPRRALRRHLTPPVALALAVAAAVAGAGGGPWGLVLLVPALAKGVLDHRSAGWRLEGDRVVLRFRRLAQRTVIVPTRRVQRHELFQTPWQRRAGLAGFRVAAGAGTSAAVTHLEEPVARALFERVR
jgi:putative membrane protein